MSLQGFDYGDVVHKFEKRCKLEYLRVRDRFIEIIIYDQVVGWVDLRKPKIKYAGKQEKPNIWSNFSCFPPKKMVLGLASSTQPKEYLV